MREDEECCRDTRATADVEDVNAKQIRKNRTMVITCVLCMCVCFIVGTAAVVSGHLGTLGGTVRAKQAIEREFGVNPHYAMHYFTRHVNGYKCVEQHRYSTRMRASWCVPEDVDVHEVAEDELRWLPPQNLFFEDGAVFGLPGENASTRERWRHLETRLSGIAYCLPPRSVRVKYDTVRQRAGPCPSLMRCVYVGAPLIWEEYVADEQYHCTAMDDTQVNADAHALWHPVDLHDVVSETRIRCKRSVGEMHYAATNVHSNYADCVLSYERNERRSDAL